jgi:phosphohistidine phosphatase
MTERVLVIMRRAKTEQNNAKRDIDRILTDGGHDDARAAGAWFVANDIRPDALLCSPAARARGTWHDVAIEIAGTASPTVSYEADLY